MLAYCLALVVNLFLVAPVTIAWGTSKPAAVISCNADAIPTPEYYGTSVTNLAAKEVKGWSAYSLFGVLGDKAPTEAIEFCNVTVTYTHPGLNDTVNVYVWLPLQGWNERFIAQGGGGWAAGAEGRSGDY